ncbi:MAG: 4Fe-4S binding protein, partial [Planctomycetota bacterium]
MPAAEIGVSARAARRRNYARWRALSLSLVYVVFALHVLHWKLSGKTLAPLELNEVMYTLELGIITAGFLFMSALVVGAMVFGRFFCSWACHIMVLQDLCAYLLRKLRIPLKPVRSRLLLWVPPLTAFYMFLWPQVVRMWRTRAFPTFHLATDADGWASFTTQHFWRNLPGPGIIVLTFLTCGFVVVYLLGSRSFCTYVCPYGAVFGLADRLAPGKIRLKGTCRQCGTCTSVCTSHIRVHEEIDRFGMVVNPACLKDLDCVGACPHGAIGYGWGKPSLLTSLRGVGRFGVPYDFSLREELVMAGVFLTVLLSFRGLYGQIPFLLSLAFGAIAAYATVTALRLAREPNVRLANRFLRERGRLTPAGQAFTVLMAAATLFVAHSGWIRYHEFTGLRLAEAAMHAPHETLSTDAEASRTIVRTEVRGSISRGVTRNPAPLELARAARAHLLTADRWGLFDNAYVERSLVGVSLRLSDPESAVVYAKRFLRRYSGDAGIRFSYARALDALGRKQEAEEQLRLVIKTTNGNPHQQ